MIFGKIKNRTELALYFPKSKMTVLFAVGAETVGAWSISLNFFKDNGQTNSNVPLGINWFSFFNWDCASRARLGEKKRNDLFAHASRLPQFFWCAVTFKNAYRRVLLSFRNIIINLCFITSSFSYHKVIHSIWTSVIVF